MITMLGSERRLCDGLTRRETLKAGALSLLGGAFSLPGLLWAAALAALLDGRLLRAALYQVVTGVAALFGVIHSALPGAPIALPGTVLASPNFPTAARYLTPYHWAAAYGLVAALLVILALWRGRSADQAAAPAE